MKYQVQDDNGTTLLLEGGDSPPTEDELKQAFGQHYANAAGSAVNQTLGATKAITDVLTNPAAGEASREGKRQDLAEQTRFARADAKNNAVMNALVGGAEKATKFVSEMDPINVVRRTLKIPNQLMGGPQYDIVPAVTPDQVRTFLDPAIEEPGTVKEGLKQFAAETLSSLTSPDQAVAILTGKVQPELVARQFQTQMASQIPASVENLRQAINTGDRQDVAKAVAGLALSAGGPALIEKGIRLDESKGKPNAKTIREDTGQPSETGQVRERGQADSGGDVQQAASGPPNAATSPQGQAPGEVLLEKAPPAVTAGEAKPSEAPVSAAVEPPVTAEGTPQASTDSTVTPAVTQSGENAPFVGMGGATPEEFTKPGSYVSNMFAAIDRDRAELGKPPMERGDPRTWDEDNQRALAQMNRDPQWIPNLIQEVLDNPRPLKSWENAGVVWHRAKTKAEANNAFKRINQAFEDGRQDDLLSAKADAARFEDELETLDKAFGRGGTGSEAGRSLQAQKMGAGDDFSLVEMRMQARAAQGGKPLSEAQEKEIARLHEELQSKTKAYDQYVADSERRLAETESRAKHAEMMREREGRITDPVLKIAEGLVNRLDTAADRARERIKARGLRFSAGLDPTVLLDVAEIGAAHIAHVGLDLAKWSAKMIEEFGEGIKPHLEEIYAASKKNLDALGTATKGSAEAVKKIVKGGFRTLDAQAQKDATVKAVKRTTDGGKPEGVAFYAQRLARSLVQNGITDREKLIDEVHSVLKEAIPELTRRQAMDAISGYGDFKQLSRDEISVKLRDLKGQMQQLGKLEDMANRIAPKKSGVERRVPTDEERRLIKQVEEAKKRGGFTVTDPETELRSALQEIKTRLTNQISDLEYQLETGKKIVKERRSVPLDKEAEDLKQRRDFLKEQYDAVFGKKELTDAQRLKIAQAGVERQIAEYERRIKEGDLSPKQRPAGPSSPELEAAKARRDALRAQLEELRDMQNPKLTPEQKALNTLKKRTANRIADYQERIAKGDFSARPRKSVVLDPEAMRLQAEAERVKKQFKRGVDLEKLRQRSGLERGADWITRWRRGFILSGPVTLAKLTSAAIQRIGFTPVEEAVGGAISKLIPQVAAKAAREGGFNSRALAKGFSSSITQGMEDAWRVLRTGQSDLDILYGKEALENPRAIDLFGHAHGALKSPAKRFEFTLSLEKRTAHAIRNGVDIQDPMVQTSLIINAYKDAIKAIFLQDNIVSDAYKNALRFMERKQKGTGEVSTAGKALATGARVLLPIVKVPTNIVAETFQYALGSITGSARLARAMSRGMENLKPEEADIIMRSLKKGSVGAAVMALGYFNPDVIGGYYQPGEKRKKGDVKAGNVKLYGHNIPSYLLHNPLLETLQIGATVRRVADSHINKKSLEQKGIGEGVYAGLIGVTEEVPFVREMGEVTKAFNPNEKGAFWGELGKSLIIPQAVQQAATYFDKNAQGETVPRKPRTVLEHIETGIPGLRKEVPKRKTP